MGITNQNIKKFKSKYLIVYIINKYRKINSNKKQNYKIKNK